MDLQFGNRIIIFVKLLQHYTIQEIMKIVKLLFTTLLSVFSCICSYAQQSWTLEECIDYAHRNNLQVKQQEVSVRQAENSVKQSKLDFIPTFNASLGYNLNWGKSVNINDLEITNQLTQSATANLGASTPILEGFAKHNTLKSNRTQLQISQQEVERLKNEITISITQAYLQLLLSIEIEKSARESFNSVARQVERTALLVEAGSQPYSALLDIEAQLSTERVQLVAAGNDIKSNRLTLLQLMDIQDDSNFTIAVPEIDDTLGIFIKESINSIYNSATTLPQIRTAELQLSKSRYDYKIQKGYLFPSISFNAGYGTYFSDSQHSRFFDQFNENRNPSMGFSLSIPIFNGWRRSAAVRNAGLNVESARIELKRRHHTLYKEIQMAANNAENSYEKYKAALHNMKASEESFEYVRNKFNAGTLNGTDYIVAKSNLFKAQSEFYQTKFQYIFQLKILDFYKGTPIKL